MLSNSSLVPLKQLALICFIVDGITTSVMDRLLKLYQLSPSVSISVRLKSKKVKFVILLRPLTRLYMLLFRRPPRM